jgi:hypothetical protein
VAIRDRKPLPSLKPQTLYAYGAPGARFFTQDLLEIRAIGLIENSPSYRLDGSPGRIRLAIEERSRYTVAGVSQHSDEYIE